MNTRFARRTRLRLGGDGTCMVSYTGVSIKNTLQLLRDRGFRRNASLQAVRDTPTDVAGTRRCAYPQDIY